MTDRIFEIRHLQKQFGDHQVLNDVNLSVERGEVVSIIGSSGSGKSTLLRCINLLETPTSGEILYKGKNIQTEIPSLYRYRAEVGMVFQQFNLYNNMDVLQNCVIGQKLVMKRSKQEAEELAMKYLTTVGMKQFINAKPRQLSGGQKQRLSIARALAHPCRILILDDSSSALDYATDAQVRKNIREQYSDVTVIAVSQRVGSIKHCDMLLVMDDGRLAGCGTHDELIKNCRTYCEICASQGVTE